jgi:thiamine monophosphate kinase
MFWKLNISNLKPVFLLEKESAYDIFTDASDVGAAGFKPTAGVIAITLPDTSANVLALLLTNFVCLYTYEF